MASPITLHYGDIRFDIPADTDIAELARKLRVRSTDALGKIVEVTTIHGREITLIASPGIPMWIETYAAPKTDSTPS